MITQETKRRVESLFPKPEWGTVISLLSTRCAQNLPGLASCSSEELERFQFAVLKISSGQLSKFYQAIDLANTDWRDLLMVAGFGEDLNAHKSWLA